MHSFLTVWIFSTFIRMQGHHPTKELNDEIIWKKARLQKKKQ
jgi:hypothetical protein